MQPHPEKWWAQMVELCVPVVPPEPLPVCFLAPFGPLDTSWEGDALGIPAPCAFPSLAPRARRKRPRPRIGQTHRQRGRSPGQAATHQPPRRSQPLPQGGTPRTDASRGHTQSRPVTRRSSPLGPRGTSQHCPLRVGVKVPEAAGL